jgi:lipoic acid synthetase
MPAWLRRLVENAGRKDSVERVIADAGLHTVCREARCPNRGECFGRGTATFLIMGNACTRACGFCHVNHAAPGPLDAGEPARLVDAVRRLNLRYAVITSVTRDDLPDGGAAHYAETVRRLKREIPGIRVEVLIPDLQGDRDALRAVLDAGPDVLNHNLETVARLYPTVRPQANYRRSLLVLSETARYNRTIFRKSGIMVGLGETAEEVHLLMRDLQDAQCQIMTIGQYLRPSPAQLPVAEYISPEQFHEYRSFGRRMGFLEVMAGPYVRSSYRAGQSLTPDNPDSQTTFPKESAWNHR